MTNTTQQDGFVIGQMIDFRASASGGWGIIMVQGDAKQRYFAHGRAFLDGPPEVYSLVAFEPVPSTDGKLPRAKRISVVATPDREDIPKHEPAKNHNGNRHTSPVRRRNSSLIN